MSLPHEVSTEKINKFLAESKTHLYLPKINSTSNKLEFVLCNKKTKFRKNSLNILEPMNEETIELKKLNAVIVPLRALMRTFKDWDSEEVSMIKPFRVSPNQNLLAWLMSFNS